MSLPDFINPNAPWMVSLSTTLYGGPARARMYRKLAHLVSNGQRVQESIDSLAARAVKRKGQWDAEAVVLSNVSRRIRDGKSLAAAFDSFVPVTERLLIEAGENAGLLPEALEHAETIILATKKLRSTVLKAMVMPAMTMAAIVGAFVVMGAFVMPKIAEQFDPTKWTGTARSVYEASSFAVSPWGLIPGALLVGFAIFVILSMKRWKGAGRAMADRIPPWSFYRLMIGGGWLISLSAMIRSGMILSQALQSMRAASYKNPWLADRLSRIIGQLQLGKNLGRAMEGAQTGFPDVEIVDDLVIYSDMPNFSEVLYRIGQQWVTEGVEAVETQAMLMNQVLFVVMAVVVGWFCFGVMEIQNQIASQLGANF